ncbi:hypothetical protein F4808DRAFT_434578 [Astrocystis sublimbata]|nr:hypothetical protein F4808DRAFT_434578 [Astrocystis sublimbata]
MAFEYEPLGPRQLRLLRPVTIHNTADSSVISFEILTVDRSRAPQYCAISYTWGDEDETETIQLDKQDFRVRGNLWSCLYHLGLSALTSRTSSRYLWVDAVCIDQTNTSEKNAQVRVMDEIYRNASYVSIWLGSAPRVEAPDVWLPQHRVYVPARRFIRRTSNFQWMDHIEALIDHPYWSRYWVIQECLLAQSLQVHYGEHVAPWAYFRDYLRYGTGIDLPSILQDSRVPEMIDSGKRGLALLLARPPNDMDIARQQRPLEELIEHHRHSQCKDPRDRVFALLGLVEVVERRNLERFFPDYSLSVDRVLVITLAHLRQMCAVPITIDSDKLFQGLGVESKERRARLLAEAECFDYFPGQAVRTALVRSLAAHYAVVVERRERRERWTRWLSMFGCVVM